MWGALGHRCFSPGILSMKRPPLLLVVLDGWGQRDDPEFNAIASSAPFFQQLLGQYPHGLLHACGREVGLPEGIMGNSEVGHMSLGAGRVINQDITRIDAAIESGEFFENGALLKVMEDARRGDKNLHLMGLVSDGAVHASDKHIVALLRMAKKVGVSGDKVLIHALTDGRDTAPRSGVKHLARLEAACAEVGVGRIVSLVGRYWAMDRDNRWERVQKAHDLLTAGIGEQRDSVLSALEQSYAAGITDEFLEPTLIGPAEGTRIGSDEPLIMFNYRSDRVREISLALAFEDFEHFERRGTGRPAITTFTQYRADFPFPIAFAPNDLSDMLPEVLSRAGLRQARIAETEKYAHVTFFFSGGKEDVLPGENRILLPSPKVATYDLAPQMSARGVTDAILKELGRAETDVFIINYANADMVGHTGDYGAACQAVAFVDSCLQEITAAVNALGGLAVITADHGNSEKLVDPESGEPHTAHTLNPVPIVFCGESLKGQSIRPHGVLADVAPTLLQVLDLEVPSAMTARSLFE